MLHLLSESTNPYFNLATEEYLLKSFSEDIFMLWRSEPSVIVGKHQNCLAEVNYKYIRENNIKIARRLSGGGTVVHDLQNLNFTFIANGEEGKLIDFNRFVQPVIDYLATLGIESHIGKTNDIRIGELKISGNAEHVYRKRILHHGTLLFNSNLSQLKDAIKVKAGTYFDKAVQSNRATVTNIIDHLPKKTGIEAFTNGLSSFIMSNSENATEYYLTEEDTGYIEKLRMEKYETEDWIYGYSPKYKYEKNFETEDGKWEIIFFVERGVIVEAKVLMNNTRHELSEHLVGIKHRYKEIDTIINPNNTRLQLKIPTDYFF